MRRARLSYLKMNIDFLNKVDFNSLINLRQIKRGVHDELMNLMNEGLDDMFVKTKKDPELIAALFLI